MNIFRGNRIIVGLAGLILAMGSVATAPSAAAAGSADEGKAQPVAPQYCNVNVETGATQCFGSFREVIAHATSGRVTDAPNDLRAAATDSKLAERINESGDPGVAVVIGVDYFWENFVTPAVVFSGPNACTGTLSDIDYRSAPLPTVGGINYNNNIRSFQGFSNCWQRLWDFSNCTGYLFGYASGSADLGAARDRAECIDFS